MAGFEHPAKKWLPPLIPMNWPSRRESPFWGLNQGEKIFLTILSPLWIGPAALASHAAYEIMNLGHINTFLRMERQLKKTPTTQLLGKARPSSSPRLLGRNPYQSFKHKSSASPAGGLRIIRTPMINIEGNVPSAPGPGVIKTPPIKIEGRIPSVGDSGADFGSVRKFGSKLDVPGWVGGASSLGSSSGNKSLLLGDSPLWDAGAKLRLAGIRQDRWHSPWRSPSLGLSLRGSGGGPLSSLWNAGSSFSSGSTSGASLAPTRSNVSTSLTSGSFSARSSAGFSPALEGLQDRLSRLNRGLEMPMLSSGRSSIGGALSGVGSYGSGFGAQGFGPNLRLNVPGVGGYGSGFGAQGSGSNLRLNVLGLGGGGTGPSLLPPGSLSMYTRGF